MFVNGVYPGKSLKMCSLRSGKPWNLVFESPGKQCSNVCTNPVLRIRAVHGPKNHGLGPLLLWPIKIIALALLYWLAYLVLVRFLSKSFRPAHFRPPKLKPDPARPGSPCTVNEMNAHYKPFVCYLENLFLAKTSKLEITAQWQLARTE